MAPAAEAQASLFRNLDTTMRALNAVARPYIQDSITGGKPALDAGIESLPNQRPFLANTEGLMRELRPGARALRTAAPALSDALGAGIEVLPKTPALNQRLDSLLRRGADVRQRPAGAARPPGHERAREVRGPDAGLPRARPDGLQLHHAVLPQHLLAAERGRQERHLAALHHRRRAGGPEQRGRPVVRPGQRPDDRQPPAHQPVPEHRLAGAAA